MALETKLSAQETELNSFEVAAFTAFVKYHISMEMRHAMMKSLPEVYNKICGSQIVATFVVPTAEKV